MQVVEKNSLQGECNEPDWQIFISRPLFLVLILRCKRIIANVQSSGPKWVAINSEIKLYQTA